MTRSHSSTGMSAKPVGREVDHDRRVVDQDVDAAERVHRGLCHRLGGLRRADVDTDADRPMALGAERLGRLRRRVVVDVGEHDRRPGLGQRLGVDHADPTGAAGDHGHLVGQVEQLCSGHGVDRTT